MSDEGFEKGLKLLLNNTYSKPQPSEEFRAQLLLKLREKQRTRCATRRHRIIALYSSVSAVAAVAVLSFIPNFNMPANDHTAPSSPSTRVLTKIDATNHTGSDFATPVSFPATSSAVASSVQTASAPITRTVSIQPKAVLGSVNNISGSVIRALNPLEYRNSSENQWQSAVSGSELKLTDGMSLRTPLGAVEPVSFVVRGGPTVMLDGSSAIKVADGGLRLEDGQAVISLSQTDKALKVIMQAQDLALQPGAMAFLRLEQGADYAQNGAPAPVLVLLRGEAATLDKFDTRLASGRVYELYDTGTGKYPSREIGSFESQRRFMPMISAMQAANVGN